MPLIVVGAVVVPFGAVTLTLRLGVRRWLATAVLLALLVLTGYVLAADAGTTLGNTVRDAVPRLLTEPQPLALRPDLLVVPVLMGGLTGLLVGLRAARTTRLAPVVGALVLYTAGALLTSGRGDPFGVIAAGVLATIVLGWVLLDETGESRRFRVLTAAPLVIVVVGLVASSALVPSERPFDPRSVVDPPLVETDIASPLPQLAAWTANPDVELFTTSGGSSAMRLVVLDAYDGTQWSAATRYGPLGVEVETPPLPAGVNRTSFTVAVRINELGGHWLPAPGDPTGISDIEALVDVRTGTLLAPDGAAGAEYEVTGEIDAVDPAALPAAGVPSGDDESIAPYLALPDPLPYELATYSALISEGTTSAYQRAAAIEQAVRGERSLSEQAISGSALWRIEDFLLGDPTLTAGAQQGTSEQFATAFAILARHGGLPTRIVVGFQPGDEQPDGSRVVRGEHAVAWPEVYFTGLGWVAFNPTPDLDLLGERPEPPVRTPAEQQATQSPDVESTQTPNDTDDPSAATDPGSSGMPPWILYGLAVVVVGAPLLLALARVLRSWRHRRRGPRGAWAEVVDGLVLAGRPAAGSSTAPLIAEQLAEVHDPQTSASVASLARAADEAAFAPERVTTARTRTLRGDLRQVRRSLRRASPWWRRLWWPFDPRVLRRRNR